MSDFDKSNGVSTKQSYSSCLPLLDVAAGEGSSKDGLNFPVTDDEINNDRDNGTIPTDTSKNEGTSFSRNSEVPDVADIREQSEVGQTISKNKGNDEIDATEKKELKGQKKGKVKFDDDVTCISDDDIVFDPFNNRTVRIIVCGEPSVGKSALIDQFITGQFPENRTATIGMEYTATKVMWSPSTVVGIEFWDMHGSRLQTFVAKDTCRTLDAGIIVCNIAEPATLHTGATVWITALRELFERNNCGNVPLTLIANKCDSPHPFMTYEILCKYAYNNNMEGCFITSAKDNVNVGTAITFAIRSALEHQIFTKEAKKGFFYSAKEAFGRVGRKLRQPFSKKDRK